MSLSELTGGPVAPHIDLSDPVQCLSYYIWQCEGVYHKQVTLRGRSISNYEINVKLMMLRRPIVCLMAIRRSKVRYSISRLRRWRVKNEDEREIRLTIKLHLPPVCVCVCAYVQCVCVCVPTGMCVWQLTRWTDRVWERQGKWDRGPQWEF